MGLGNRPLVSDKVGIGNLAQQYGRVQLALSKRHSEAALTWLAIC
jgi:hypothetical protein